jgi:hypothetical protein
MLAPENAKAFVSALLRDVDPTAEVVECTFAPDGLGYRVQLQIHGDTTKVGHFPAGLPAHPLPATAPARRAPRLRSRPGPP